MFNPAIIEDRGALGRQFKSINGNITSPRKPDPLPEPGPLFQWPLRPIKIAKFLFAPESFLWPFNLFYALLAIFVWYYFTPGPDRTATFAVGWIAGIYLRNVVLLILIVGGLHLRLYTGKGQGIKFKYTNKWLEVKNKKFLFGNQTADNVFWNLTSGAMIWTAWEAVSLWMFANDKIPYIDFRSNPVYFVLLMIAVIFIRLTHFYWIHRLIHWKPLFRACHYLHHKNTNIGPWSGLSMHPLEHLLYFSGAVFHWIIPSHPIHMIFHLLHAGVSPARPQVTRDFTRLLPETKRGLRMTITSTTFITDSSPSTSAMNPCPSINGSAVFMMDRLKLMRQCWKDAHILFHNRFFEIIHINIKWPLKATP